MYKNKTEVRRAFWELHPNADRQKITDYSGHGKMYKTDTRCMFCDFIEYLHRSGQITDKLAQTITL